jgi:hypothetical protein
MARTPRVKAEELRDLIRAGRTRREVAAHFGLAEVSLYNYCRAHGLPLPPTALQAAAAGGSEELPSAKAGGEAKGGGDPDGDVAAAASAYERTIRALPLTRERVRALVAQGRPRQEIAGQLGVSVGDLVDWCGMHGEPLVAPQADPEVARRRGRGLAKLFLDPPEEGGVRLVATRPSGLPPLSNRGEVRSPRPAPPPSLPPGRERPLGWVRRVTIQLPDPATGGRRALYIDTDSAAGIDVAVTFGAVFGFPVHVNDAPPWAVPQRCDLAAADR